MRYGGFVLFALLAVGAWVSIIVVTLTGAAGWATLFWLAAAVGASSAASSELDRILTEEQEHYAIAERISPYGNTTGDVSDSTVRIVADKEETT